MHLKFSLPWNIIVKLEKKGDLLMEEIMFCELKSARWTISVVRFLSRFFLSEQIKKNCFVTYIMASHRKENLRWVDLCCKREGEYHVQHHPWICAWSFKKIICKINASSQKIRHYIFYQLHSFFYKGVSILP
jgi:hypothetical protein